VSLIEPEMCPVSTYCAAIRLFFFILRANFGFRLRVKRLYKTDGRTDRHSDKQERGAIYLDRHPHSKSSNSCLYTFGKYWPIFAIATSLHSAKYLQ